jgi:MFS family permease
VRKAGNERLLLVVGSAIFLETLFYAVITPLLPQLSHQLHLSKLTAGVMTAAYPAGTLIGSLPGGAIAVRRGPRFTLVWGLALVVASTVAFGLLRSAPGLDLARFVEGVGGAFAWAGGLAWIVAATPPQRRGAVMGSALGTAIAGSLFGPAVGALASATGRAALFCGLAAVTTMLLVPIAAQHDARDSSGQPVTEVLRELRRPALAGAMWLMALPAIVSGVLNVLGPLQLHRLGAGAAVIGATFLAGAAIEALISPAVGRYSDRHGRTLPLRGGLIGVGVGAACFSLASSTLGLALLLVATAAPLGVFWAPVMALVADVAEAQGIDQAHAAALMNLSWAAGQIVGSAGGGATGRAFGDGAPTLALTVICLLTLLGLRAVRRPRMAPAVARGRDRRA